MKYVLLTLFAMLVCSCDNYIPSIKEISNNTKVLNGVDSIANDGNSSIIIEVDTTSNDYNYIINVPCK